MAGFYPDVPDHRMAYDRLGCVLLSSQAASNTVGAPAWQGESRVESASLLTTANRDDGSVWYSHDPYYSSPFRHFCIIFPTPMDITGALLFYTVNSPNSVVNVQTTTTPTTTGMDGTWVSQGTSAYRRNFTKDATRQEIRSVSWLDTMAIRFGLTGGANNGGALRSVHLYGSRASGDRLRLWHPTLDEEVGPAYFDWGDIRQSASGDKTFRVKNDSLTMRALTPVVGLSALTDPTPSVVGQHLLSTDGTTFGASAVLPALEPQEISQVVTLRYNVAANAAVAIWAARVAAVAALWEVA